MRPPCASATAVTSDRPRPDPGSVRLLSSRTKRCSTRSRSSSGTPGPLSVTENSTSPDERRRARNITAPPSGVYLMALSIRLARAWARKGWLPSIISPFSISAANSSPLSSPAGSYNSAMSAARSAASNTLGSGAPPACRRAMARTVLKVLSRASASSSATPKASTPDVRPASASIRATSILAFIRFSGVRRSWAMASPAWRIEAIEPSSRSSIPFRPSASSSNSSPEWRIGTRVFRSPSCTAATTRFRPAMARSTPRLIHSPPPTPSTSTMTIAPHRA